MTGILRYVLAICALALPGVAVAHPHIYVETGLRVVTGEGGRIEGVEVTWRYDEFYSLLVLEDMELDGDYDGRLTAEELARLDGFDMQWVEGYEGDLYASEAGDKLSLGKPEPRGTEFADGKITTRHYRAVDFGGHPDGGPVVLKAYDPGFYTAYDLNLGVDVPKGCEVAIHRADIGEAQKKLLDELAQIPADEDSDYPEVGETFADAVEVTCAGS